MWMLYSKDGILTNKNFHVIWKEMSKSIGLQHL